MKWGAAFFLFLLYSLCLHAESADRASDANNAKNQGDTGALFSAALGSAMVARALPLLASINPSDVAAGADLMAKAGLEFAQTAAMAASASKNRDQRDTLLRNEQLGGNESLARNPSSTGNLQSPGLDQFLKNRGVDETTFKNNLINGAYSKTEDVLSALNMSGRVGENDLRRGEKAADRILKEIASDKNAPDTASASASGDERAPTSSPASSEATKGDEKEKKDGPLEFIPLFEEGRRDKNKHSDDGFENFMNSEMFKKAAATGFSPGLAERKLHESEIILEKSNIYPATGRGQIFQIAHRNYREYSKWRKNQKNRPN